MAKADREVHAQVVRADLACVDRQPRRSWLKIADSGRRYILAVTVSPSQVHRSLISSVPGGGPGMAASAAGRFGAQTGSGAWVAALRRAARARRVARGAQGSISRIEALGAALHEMLDRVGQAMTLLRAERDGLREELAALRDSPPSEAPGQEDLRRRLRDVQRRLDVTRALEAATGQRLAESRQQRELAQRLRDEAAAQAEQARLRLARLENRPALAGPPTARAPAPASPPVMLLGDTDQQGGDEALRRAGQVLHDEAATLSQLRDDLSSTPGGRPAPGGVAWQARRRLGRVIRRHWLAVSSGAAVAVIGSVAAVSALSGAPGVSGPAHASGTPGNVRAPSVARAWAYATGGSVYSSPAVAGGTVYVGSNDGKTYALNAATGKPDWTRATGSDISFSPAVAGQVVYVGSNDGQVYALNARPDRKNRGAPEASGAQPLR